MVSATTPCAFHSPIRTAAKGTAASSRGIHVDRPFQVPSDLGRRARVDLRPNAAGEHPGVGVEHAPGGVVDRKRPDENETGEEPEPMAPGFQSHRQRAEGHVGEEIARLGRHEEQEGSGQHAQHADPAGDEDAPAPERVCSPAHDRSPPKSFADGVRKIRWLTRRRESDPPYISARFSNPGLPGPHQLTSAPVNAKAPKHEGAR